ncbi:MAG: hypothetical protein FWJ93_02455 [Micromonosporaceae bacterium]
MDLGAAARRLRRRYWPLLLASVALPLGAAGADAAREPRTYTATARVLASPEEPASAAGSAALVNQVAAFATSRDVIAQALVEAGSARTAERVVGDVSVTGVGTSAMADLAYTDRDPQVAAAISAALAGAVVQQLNQYRQGGLPEAIEDLDRQIATLTAERGERAQAARARPWDRVARDRLAQTEQRLGELLAARDRVVEDLAGVAVSSVLALPTAPAAPDPRRLPARVPLAGFAGLTLGVSVMVLGEARRARGGSARRRGPARSVAGSEAGRGPASDLGAEPRERLQ